MLSTLSVKKPYTVLVAVVLVLVLGVVSFMNMTTDLLPGIELPYIVVATTYPGASPEKIEQTVTKPLESVLGTTGGVKNVQSVSRENSSMIILEFAAGTNMDSAMIELSGNVDLVSANLDDAVGAPMLMKISPDMLPVMVASVDISGADLYEVSDTVNDTIIPAFERLDGVASVSATGLVEKRISVTLNQSQIDAINDKVLASVDVELAKAQQELRDSRAKIAEGQAKLDSGKNELASKKEDGISQMAQGSAQIDAMAAQLNALLSEETTLQANKAAFEMEKQGYEKVLEAYNSMNGALGGISLPPPFQSLLIEAIVAMPAEQFAELKEMLTNGLPPEVAEKIPPETMAMLAALKQEDIAKLKEATDLANKRIPEVEAELKNITTRMAVISAMKPELEANVKKLQDAYAALESGKMTAVGEMTKGEVMLTTTEKELEQARVQLDQAQEEMDKARDAAYEKADISGVLTADMVANILMAENFSMPAGYLKEGGEQYLVKVGDQYTDTEELANTLLFHSEISGVGDVRLRDVATVQITDNAADSYAKINGNPGVILSFQKQSTASTAAVSKNINAQMEKMQSENSDVHVTALMDQGDYIELVVNSVLENLIIGGVLAVLILALFLKDFKPTFIVACSIPFSLMCAITAMYFSNVTLNIISLSGLALGVGMLVDNSIVVIENIYRLRNEGMSAPRAAVMGAKQVAGAIFASTLTTICVFLPIVFTQGISRDLFTDMGLTIAYSLLASLLVALTLVPAMGATVLKNTKEKDHPWFNAFADAYRGVLRWSLRHKAAVLGLTLALLAVCVWRATQMGTAFMPAMDSPQMSATLTMPKGSTKADTYAMSDTVMERVAELESVETVGAMAGGGGMALMSGGGGSGNSVSFYILLKADAKQSNAEAAKAITEATKDLNCTLSVQESNMDMSAMGGSGIELVIRGQNLDEMNQVANDLRALLRDTEGTVDISEAKVTDNSETRIIVDKNKAMMHSLTVAQVYSEVSKALKSEASATTLTMNAQDYPVVVVKGAEDTYARDTIMNLAFTVTNQKGEKETVYLRDIAQRIEADSVQAINRSNGARTVTVTAGVDETHNIGLVSRALEEKLADYSLPEGCDVTLAGENESINSAMRDLALMLLLAIIFIYLIMVAQFQSLLSPFIVMFTIPLAFTGGLLALWVTGQDLSIVSVLGFLVLSGIVVNNGIVFVDTINQLRLEGVSRVEAILQTGRTRLRPVLMTALTTILAMSTMALGIGQGAEMTQPMAIVTIGGLTYATLLTLVVVPVLYDIFQHKPMRKVEVDEHESI